MADGAGTLAYVAFEPLPPGPETVVVVTGGNIDPKLRESPLS